MRIYFINVKIWSQMLIVIKKIILIRNDYFVLTIYIYGLIKNSIIFDVFFQVPHFLIF